MSIPSSNPQSFGWIKSALSQAMLQAEESVSSAESTSDLNNLSEVPKNLHQIQGSLQMVELGAASVFAEDMEALTEQLYSAADTDNADDAVRALKSGLNSLKQYLAEIEGQTPQSPLILVEDINSVRQYLDKEPITQYELFDPPLELDSSITPIEPVEFPEDKRRNVVFHLRKRFRQALIAWLNDTNQEQPLSVMSDLMIHLRRVGGSEVFQQLWWVAAGFVDSIKNGDISADAQVKAQFANLDNEISRLHDDNRAAIASSPPDELLRKMLFLIGRYAKDQEDSETLSLEIKHKLHLDQWFDFDTASIHKDSVTELVDSITQFAAEIDTGRLNEVESVLDQYFSEQLDSEKINELYNQFDELYEISTGYEVEEISNLLLAISKTVKVLNLDSKVLLETGADIKIASALLLFKDTLSTPSMASQEWKTSIIERTNELHEIADQNFQAGAIRYESNQQADREHSLARGAVADEARKQLNTFEQFISDLDFAQLQDVDMESAALNLTEIGKWVGMLNAGNVQALAQSTSDELVKLENAALENTQQYKENFAFIIASIGVCVDILEEGGDQPKEIIGRAYKRLDDIKALDSVGNSETDELKSNDQEQSAYDESLIISTLDMGDDPLKKTEQKAPRDERAVSEELIEDELIEDELIEDELIEDELVEDELVEDELIEDEIHTLEVESDSVPILLEQLNSIRKSILDSEEQESDVLHLLLLFNAIEDNVEKHENPDTRLLADIGSTLSVSLVNQEITYSSQVNDFIGLLCRQIHELEQNPESSLGEESLGEWKIKLQELITDQRDTNTDTRIEGQSSEAFDDLELKSVFIDELQNHSAILAEISAGMLQILQSNDAEKIDFTQQYDEVSRVNHTLTGNFNNVGLDEFGGMLAQLQPLIKMDSGDRNLSMQYFDAIADFARLIDETAEDVRNSNTVSDSSIEKFKSIQSQFRIIQGNLDKSAAPLETQKDLPGEDIDHHINLSVTTDDESSEIDSEVEVQVGSNETGEFDILDDDVDEELRQIFLEESESLLSRVNEYLTEWRSSGKSEAMIAGIRREFHTLKGSAAMCGYGDISRLSHAVESLMEQDGESELQDDSALLNLLEEMHDGVAAELGYIPGAGDEHIRSLIGMVELLLSGDDLEQQTDLITDADVEMPESDVEAESTEAESDEDGSIDTASMDTVSIESELEEISELLNELNQERIEVNDSLAENDEETSDQSQAVVEHGHEIQKNPDNESIAEENLAESKVEPDNALSGRNRISPVQPRTERPEPLSTDSSVTSSRIENRKLTELLNFSGELGLTRTQLKNTLDGTREELNVLRDSMKLIRDGLRDLEFEADAQMRSMPEKHEEQLDDESFDPLQLDRYSRLQARAREVNQQLDVLTRVERQLSDRASDLGGALIQQLHLGEQLQDGLINARMASINDYVPRMRQLVREVSRRAGKEVAFYVEGNEIEVDRQVMDTMMPPFEHMIRNSIVHGIESSEARQAIGKPKSGRIDLKVVQQGAELLIEFSDDGNGLNKKILSSRVVELGLADSQDQVRDEQLLQIISEPGYSTAETVDLDSGRGVGMDVVHQAVRTLGGSMGVATEDGNGVVFSFLLPVTMTISQALLVRIGAYRFAILSRTIERVMRIRAEDIHVVDGNEYLELNNKQISIVSLIERMGETSLSTSEVYRSLVLVRLSNRIVAFEVDQFEESLEIVTKTPGSQLTSIEGITGVTVLADTSIVLILNPAEFLDRSVIQRPQEIVDQSPLESIDATPHIADIQASKILERILVVDDSLVVRKIMQRDIEGLGLQVISAFDGLNALEVLEQSEVDIALIDLEMPRMNGYELLKNLRENHKYQSLPVIVITSRSGDMHRDRAMSLGADGYVTKPYNIQSLEDMMKSIFIKKATKH